LLLRANVDFKSCAINEEGRPTTDEMLQGWCR
jgi:hypothetical protein